MTSQCRCSCASKQSQGNGKDPDQSMCEERCQYPDTAKSKSSPPLQRSQCTQKHGHRVGHMLLAHAMHADVTASKSLG